MVTDDSRIGECDACHARFKVPASFRADRARCRECGGVVILERTHPVPRPPLERSRKSKPSERPDPRGERTEERSTSGATRTEARETHSTSEHAPAHGTAVEPTGAPRPSKPAEKPAVEKAAAEKDRTSRAKEANKSGVLGSIVAAAKAAMWRKKRDGRDERS